MSSFSPSSRECALMALSWRARSVYSAMERIHSEESSAELARCCGCGSAAGEEVTHEITFLGRSEDHAVEQRLRLLRCVAYALRVLLLKVLDVVPNVAREDGRVLIIGVDFTRGTDGEADTSFSSMKRRMWLRFSGRAGGRLAVISKNTFALLR